MSSAAPRLFRAKVGLIGAPGVGKSSLVRRFVHSIFDENYHSTLGVKVDRRSVEVGDATVAMLVWDMHGETEGLEVPKSYLRGLSAAIAVIDASRPDTAAKAGELRERCLEVSPNAMVHTAANKSDLSIDWAQVDTASESAGLGTPARSSAKDGTGVEELFSRLAQQIVDLAGATPTE